MLGEGRCALKGPVSFGKGKLRSKVPMAVAVHPTPTNDNVVFQHVSLANTPRIPTGDRFIAGALHTAALRQKGTGIFAIRRVLSTLFTLHVSGYVLRVSTPRPPMTSNNTLAFSRVVLRTNVIRLRRRASVLALRADMTMCRSGGFVATLPCSNLHVAFASVGPRPLLNARVGSFAVSGRACVERVTPSHAVKFA